MAGSRSASIGPVVIFPGSRSCSAAKMTQRYFLVIPHIPGSPVSSVGSAPPTFPGVCLFLLYNLDLGHFIHAQGLCILSIPELFLSLYLQVQPLS